MAWNDWLSTLNDALADLYPTIDESRRVVACAGLPPRMIRFDPASLINWYNILEYSERGESKSRAVLDCALRDHPDHPILVALKTGEPPVRKAPPMRWEAPVDAAQLEKITGAQSTLLPIAFLDVGLTVSRSVARIVRSDGSSGTGFLIGGGWMLTNNHVLPTFEEAEDAVAQFNYQATASGTDAAISAYQLDRRRFHTSAANDWTVIGIKAAAEQKWGFIPLQAVETKVNAFVNIIQHPGGGPKQVGLYHNTVVFAGEGRVQYLTDTLPGSSGAPVFNDAWHVVALHHSGGMIREPGTKRSFYRNEGIAITTVLAELVSVGVTFDA
ncbi:MAG TPA: trypsin-like peptidase domain-containing protein [Thermoanaerobaculia bacterium]|jgi:V8-like Glu-specific endopeptidase